VLVLAVVSEGSPAAAYEPASATQFEKKRAELIELMQKGPLFFRRGLFVVDMPMRFGEYRPRPNVPFVPNEEMHIYLEPVGLVWKRDGDVSHIDVLVSIEIATEGGEVIVREKDFGRITGRNRENLVELMNYLTLKLASANTGLYVITIGYRDINSDKTAQIRLPFTIAAQAEGFTPAADVK